jgi:hypothetical protein
MAVSHGQLTRLRQNQAQFADEGREMAPVLVAREAVGIADLHGLSDHARQHAEDCLEIARLPGAQHPALHRGIGPGASVLRAETT